MATEPKDSYLISEAMVNRLFAGSAIIMVLTILALLLVLSAVPQGSLSNVNTQQFEASRASAISNLEGYRQTDDGRITIDIQRAMELVVERGLD